MSHAASTTPVFDVRAKMQGVMGTLGYMPAIAYRAVAERNFDTLSHHRQSVLKHHGLPGKRRAQKALATNLKRFVRDLKTPEKPADIAGEGFAIGLSGQSDWGDFLKNLEEGGTLVPQGGGRFAVPFRRPKRFRELLEQGKLFVVGKGLLIQHVKGRGQKGDRAEVWGILAKRRVQRALLGYYRQWDSVVAVESPEYDRDLDRVLTEAGRARLEREYDASAAGRAAFTAALNQFLAANPGRHAEARRAAARVAREVRRAAKAAPRGGGGA